MFLWIGRAPTHPKGRDPSVPHFFAGFYLECNGRRVIGEDGVWGTELVTSGVKGQRLRAPVGVWGQRPAEAVGMV